MGKKRASADHRADTKGGPLSGFPHCVADSPAYLDLSPFDRAVLAEILRRFNGYNNGAIVISYEEIGERLRGSNACRPNNGRIGRAVASLMQHGLIAEPTPASWLQRKAREYRLTFISSGKAPPFRPATNDYLKWKPEEKNHGNAASPDTPSIGYAASPEHAGTGDPASPANLKNRSFALVDPSSPGDGASLLIAKPSPSAAKREESQSRTHSRFPELVPLGRGIERRPNSNLLS